MTAPPDFPTGTCRFKPDGTAVAIRTALPSPAMAWGVMTIDNGGHYTTWDEVAEWRTTPVPAAKAKK